MSGNYLPAKRLGYEKFPKMHGFRNAPNERKGEQLYFRYSKGFVDQHGDPVTIDIQGTQCVFIDIWWGGHVNTFFPVPYERFVRDYVNSPVYLDRRN